RSCRSSGRDSRPRSCSSDLTADDTQTRASPTTPPRETQKPVLKSVPRPVPFRMAGHLLAARLACSAADGMRFLEEGQAVRQKIPRFAAMAFIVTAAACGGVSGQPAGIASKPPSPTVTFQAKLDSPDVSGDFDEVQLLIEFPPGAWTPVHS